MQNFWKIILAISFVFTLHTNISFAQNIITSLDLSENTPVQGENISINLNFETSEEINISTFRLRVNFDAEKLKYTGLYSNYNSDDFKSYLNGNILTIIYLTSEKGITLSENSLHDFLTLDFKVLSTNQTGNTKINATIDGVGNYNADEIISSAIGELDLNIVNAPLADCNLKLLTVKGYELSPNFSENITQYSVSVPSNVSNVDIIAVPSDEAAIVKVSRKTLNASGKITDIKVTVTGFDKKSKKVYTISVKRGINDKTKSSSSSSSSSNGTNKNGTSVSNAQNDNNESTVFLIKNNFNFALFFIVMAICIGVAVFVIKKKT